MKTKERKFLIFFYFGLLMEGDKIPWLDRVLLCFVGVGLKWVSLEVRYLDKPLCVLWVTGLGYFKAWKAFSKNHDFLKRYGNFNEYVDIAHCIKKRLRAACEAGLFLICWAIFTLFEWQWKPFKTDMPTKIQKMAKISMEKKIIYS